MRAALCRDCAWDKRRAAHPKSHEDKDGYVLLKIKGRKRWVAEHKLIAEKALGRTLRHGEVVHHINGVKSDNRNCNLLICTTSYHLWLHSWMASLYMKEHFC